MTSVAVGILGTKNMGRDGRLTNVLEVLGMRLGG
jgi:hypothetical protein